MNNASLKPAFSPANLVEKISVDGTFISIRRFGEDGGTPYTKMCVLARLPRTTSPRLLFLDASPVEAQIKELGINNRQKVRLVFLRSSAGNRAAEISLSNRLTGRQSRRRQG